MSSISATAESLPSSLSKIVSEPNAPQPFADLLLHSPAHKPGEAPGFGLLNQKGGSWQRKKDPLSRPLYKSKGLYAGSVVATSLGDRLGISRSFLGNRLFHEVIAYEAE